MFSWTLRIAGWIIGIYAMLELAAATGAVTYTTVFQAWMDQLRDILDLGFILKPLTQAVILPALDLIRSFDIPIPPLQDHWQQGFVLTWLLTAAWARNLPDSVPTPVALGLAFLCTLPFCVVAGTMPVDSLAVLIWPLAGLFAFLAILSLLSGGWDALHMAATAGLFAVAGYIIGTVGVGTGALVVLAVAVGAVGLFHLVIPVLFDEGTLWQRFQNPYAAIGLDITAAILGAFGLATAFADPPLF